MIKFEFQGTPPFMSIALLMNGAEGVVHEVKHDLESLFYVVIYCATMLKGPHGSWRVDEDFKSYTSMLMKEWFSLAGMEFSYAHMGRLKLSHMEDFDRSIIQRMDRYFSPLFPGFQALRDAAFPLQKNTYVNCQLDYKPMIATFNEILASLPQKHTRPEPMPRAITANIGMKRKYGHCEYFCTELWS